MKNAKILIDHIYENPLYKKLNNAREYARLVAAMQPHHKNFIAFCYVHGSVLTFALKHPAGLQELRHNSNIISIKSLLKILIAKSKSDGKISVFENVNEIKFFFLQGIRKNQEVAQSSQIFRQLRSKGEFINLCQDKNLYQKFEELRAVIKAKNGTN